MKVVQPSRLALIAVGCLAVVVLLQYLRFAPIGNVLATAIFFHRLVRQLVRGATVRHPHSE